MEVLGCRFRRLVLGVVCMAVLPGSNASTNTHVQLNSLPPRIAPAPLARVLPERTVSLDDKHRIQPGDKLSFRIEEDKEPALSLTVTDSGEFELPHGFGRFLAANKTCKSLAQEIRLAVQKEYFHRATVHLGIETINNVRGKAYVSGAVTRSGPVDIPVNTPLRLREALLQAGPTQWAKLSEIRVVRERSGKTETMMVDADAILNKGRLENDISLEPGDLVIVHERGVIFGR